MKDMMKNETSDVNAERHKIEKKFNGLRAKRRDFIENWGLEYRRIITASKFDHKPKKCLI